MTETTEELEKQRSKIIQVFVARNGKLLSAVMVKGKDPVHKIKDQLKIDPSKARAIMFFNGVELEMDKPVYTYDIHDSSEVVVELEDIPQQIVNIPCDRCGGSFPEDLFTQHRCAALSTSSSYTSNNQTEDLIPCELCNKSFPVSKYMDHASKCR